MFLCGIKNEEHDDDNYRKRQPAGEEVRRVCPQVGGCKILPAYFVFARRKKFIYAYLSVARR